MEHVVASEGDDNSYFLIRVGGLLLLKCMCMYLCFCIAYYTTEKAFSLKERERER